LEGGWNIAQSNTGQEIEGDFSPQKNDTAISEGIASRIVTASNLDEPLASINTQITESNDVPTTIQNLYESGGGWNIGQPHTGQGIEDNFSSQKNERNSTAILKTDESLASTNTQTTERDNVPATPQNLYESDGGWNTNQSQNGQRVEGDLSSQKMEPNQRANAERRNSNLASSNEQPLSTTTRTTDKNLVPTTTQNLYETEVGWNTNQSQTEQGIEGDFSPRKNELTDDELQTCLKELRQVNTANDYWVLYEQNSQLVSEAWKLLHLPEQLRIQQICDEGIDPLSKWKEGDRCLLWHPFAENKWGLATVKQVVRGACGFIYVLRDDGFGLHLGREKLNLIAPI
jgi:hypothetical protein